LNLLLAILTFVIPGFKDAQRTNLSTWDARFTIECDAQKTPPFKVVAFETGRTVLILTREQLGGRRVEFDWASDDPVLVVLLHRRAGDQIRVWRFDSGHAVDISPNSPQDSLSLGIAPWFAADKLHLKGHKRTYTLTVERKRSHIE
jgi:hypothetical protein